MSDTLKRYFEVDELNAAIQSDLPGMVKDNTRWYYAQIEAVAKTAIAMEAKDHPVVLINGPTSSGKTTSAYRVRDRIQATGRDCDILSLDNFYKEQADIPLRENGEKDYECPESIDMERALRAIELLQSGGTYQLEKEFYTDGNLKVENSLTLDEGGILIVEGLHALHPTFADNPRVGSNRLTVYACVESSILQDSEKYMSRMDIRLARRMIRGLNFRDEPIEMTLEMWDTVLDAETKYILPHKHTADMLINTFHSYELGIYHKVLGDKLAQVPETSPYYARAQKYLGRLSGIAKVSPDVVPADDLLHEFLG